MMPRAAPEGDFSRSNCDWKETYAGYIPEEEPRRNRSGLEIRPLYTPDDLDAGAYMETLAFPGQHPYTRGIYATMHRGCSWSR